jgi:hypothetical protein
MSKLLAKGANGMGGLHNVPSREEWVTPNLKGSIASFYVEDGDAMQGDVYPDPPAGMEFHLQSSDVKWMFGIQGRPDSDRTGEMPDALTLYFSETALRAMHAKLGDLLRIVEHGDPPRLIRHDDGTYQRIAPEIAKRTFALVASLNEGPNSREEIEKLVEQLNRAKLHFGDDRILDVLNKVSDPKEVTRTLREMNAKPDGSDTDRA